MIVKYRSDYMHLFCILNYWTSPLLTVREIELPVHDIDVSPLRVLWDVVLRGPVHGCPHVFDAVIAVAAHVEAEGPVGRDAVAAYWILTDELTLLVSSSSYDCDEFQTKSIQ